MDTSTQSFIADALGILEIRQGDIVLIHNSLKSFCKVENGPSDIVKAISQAVGEYGSIHMIKTRGLTTSHPRRLNRIEKIFRERKLVR